MNRKYLIRLDDACPTMDAARWQRMFDILDRNGIRPMVGVIPANEDPQQQVDAPDPLFWENVVSWQQKGYTIALHGYTHVYLTTQGLNGLNPMWTRSEFAGLPLAEQKQKIRLGIVCMREHGINPTYFFAPSHTFDEDTLVALREESDVRIISDTIATHPYRYKGFVFIPQFGGRCRKMRLSGTFTFCLHPSTMTDADFADTERFLSAHRSEFASFDALDLSNVGSKSIKDRLLAFAYFTLRRIRNSR